MSTFIETIPTYAWWLVGILLYCVGGYFHVQRHIRNKKAFKENLEQAVETTNKTIGKKLDRQMDQSDVEASLQIYLVLSFLFWIIPDMITVIAVIAICVGGFIQWLFTMLTLPMR